jgi:hypothetical protein
LPIIIVADSLYSTGPFVTELQELRYSYLLVAKPEDHKTLFEDIEGLRRGGMLERVETLGVQGSSTSGSTACRGTGSATARW